MLSIIASNFSFAQEIDRDNIKNQFGIHFIFNAYKLYDTKIDVDRRNFIYSNNWFDSGIWYRRTLSKELNLQFEADFVNRQLSFFDTLSDFSIKEIYLQIPFMLGLNLTSDSENGNELLIQLGPTIAFLVDREYEFNSNPLNLSNLSFFDIIKFSLTSDLSLQLRLSQTKTAIFGLRVNRDIAELTSKDALGLKYLSYGVYLGYAKIF